VKDNCTPMCRVCVRALGVALVAVMEKVTSHRAIKHVGQTKTVDPNEKLGPTGFGEARYVSGQMPVFYTVHFENLTNAVRLPLLSV